MSHFRDNYACSIFVLFSGADLETKTFIMYHLRVCTLYDCTYIS